MKTTNYVQNREKKRTSVRLQRHAEPVWFDEKTTPPTTNTPLHLIRQTATDPLQYQTKLYRSMFKIYIFFTRL